MIMKHSFTKEEGLKAGVYKIINLVNGKFYIESSKQFYSRKASHLSSLRLGNHANEILQNAWNKYGEENLKFEMLATCPKEYAIKLEQWFIDNLKPKYNIRKNATSNLGIKFTKPSTLAKKRAVQAVNWGNPEYRIKQTKARSIPILCYLKDTNEFVGEFPSGIVAAKELNLSHTTLMKVLKRKIDSTGGYKFKYKNEELNKLKIREQYYYEFYKEGTYLGKYSTFDEAAKALDLNAICLAQRFNGKYPWGAHGKITIIKTEQIIHY